MISIWLVILALGLSCMGLWKGWVDSISLSSLELTNLAEEDSDSYSCVPITRFFITISFLVRVPVLSVNTYSIIPSSSLRDDLKALAVLGSSLLLGAVLMKLSWVMKYPWMVFTISIDTIREMGIMVLRRMKQLLKLRRTQATVGVMWQSMIMLVRVTSQYVLSPATITISSSCSRNTKIISTFTFFSIMDILFSASPQFSIILVFSPTYTTSPITNTEFLGLDPLYTRFLMVAYFSFYPCWIRAQNLYREDSGALTRTVSCFRSLNSQFWVNFRAFFVFKAFSPSKELVSKYITPYGLQVLRRSRSAGEISLSLILSIIPNLMFLASICPQSFVSSSHTWCTLLLLSLSHLYLQYSSAASLRRLTVSTSASGSTAEYQGRGEMTGIDCMIAVMRKQMLTNLLNCRMRARGMKERRVYLVVVTSLEGPVSGLRGRMDVGS